MPKRRSQKVSETITPEARYFLLQQLRIEAGSNPVNLLETIAHFLLAPNLNFPKTRDGTTTAASICNLR
jgi:hypothetical protein